jgi:plastocyanin
MLPRVRFTIVVCLLLFCAIWCLPPFVAPAYAADSATIVIMGPDSPPGFVPSILTIHAGTAITFVNNATPQASFVIVANDNSFTSPSIAPGQPWTTGFSKPGTYGFHASTHPGVMVGTVVVVDNSLPLLPTLSPDQQSQAITDIRQQSVPNTSVTGINPLFLWFLFGGIALIILVAFFVYVIRRSRVKQAH